MHKRSARLLAISLFSAVAALAQPVIQGSVVSAASYRAPGMPGSGVAQGSIFYFYGTGLGPETFTQAYTFPLPTQLGGTSISVNVGGTTAPAILLYSYNTVVAGILPSTVPTGTGSLTLTYNGQTSAPAPILVVASAFGIFTVNSGGSGQASATDVNYQSNSIIHTFHPGDYVTLWGTGLGAVSGGDAVVPPYGNIGSVTVYVGNTTASVVTYHGRSGYSGLDQIDFQLPAGVTGCYVPIGVEAGGIHGNIGNIATIAVSDSGETCSDSIMGQDLVADLAAGQTVEFGLIRLESLIAPFLPGEAGFAADSDAAMATFSAYTPATAGLAEYGVSSGYCVAVDCSNGCSVDSSNGSISDSSPAQLDAGTVSVNYGPNITLNQYNGYYSAPLYEPNGTRYLWSGFTYPVAGLGGTAVGTFSTSDLTSIPSLTFTSPVSGANVPLSGDLTVTWTGGNPNLQNGQVTIGGYSAANTNFNQLELFQCTAPLAAGQFTIPGWVLSALPPAGSGVNDTIKYPLAWIWIGQYNNPTAFSATGLTKGMMTDIFYNGLGVYYQ